MTPAQGFDVLNLFLERYWIRGGRSSDDIAILLGSLAKQSSSGLPLDQALWQDWLEAWTEISELGDSALT
jgi:hypothetical protein